jgi:5'-methylthioadenosine phosphorylase
MAGAVLNAAGDAPLFMAWRFGPGALPWAPMSNLRIGLIGGTGLGEAMLEQSQGRRHEIDTPFGRPSDAIVETQWAGVSVFVLSRHGPGHVLNPSQVPYRANIFAMKQLGVSHILASGAVGSLREEFKPRDLVVVEQVIDRTYRRIGTFFDRTAVHVEFAEPFSPVLRQILIEAGQQLAAESTATPPASPSAEGSAAPARPLAVHDRGCYVCMEGPAFSSRAESLMHRLWGGDLIGMTAMPEAKLAREAEISYALVGLVTDYDCWRPKPVAPVASASSGASASASAARSEPSPDASALLAEILGNLKAASDNGVRLLQRAVELMAQRRQVLDECPAQQALRQAIWSQPQRIDPAEVRRLWPLWGRYFPADAAPPPVSATPSGAEHGAQS